MSVDVPIDLLTAALDDPTTGVNQVLTAMVSEFGWVTDVPAPYEQILAETDDLSAALGQLPQVPEGRNAADYFPALLVGQSDDSDGEPAAKANQIRDYDTELLIRDADRKAQPGTRQSLRRMRAVARVIERFFQGAEADRQQDGIYLWYVTGLRIVPVWQPVGDALCTCAIRLRLKLRDSAAY